MTCLTTVSPPQRRDDMMREIEQNHIRVKEILAELEATQPEIECITEIVGEEAVLDELAKHPVEFVRSNN